MLFFLASLGRRELNVRCVATSLQTETTARGLGIPVEPFDELERLDLAVDGADQVAPDGWLVKGGGAALTREKIVAAAAERFVVIVSSDKLVEATVRRFRSRSSPTAPDRPSHASAPPSCETFRRAGRRTDPRLPRPRRPPGGGRRATLRGSRGSSSTGSFHPSSCRRSSWALATRRSASQL